MNPPANKLLELGFTYLPMKEHFGYELPRVRYLYRKFQDNHQYVSLMYDYVNKLDANMNCYGDFLEAVFEAYWGKKDTRRPKGTLKAREMELKGWKPVHCTIYRNTDDLVSAVSQEYQLSPLENSKKS